MLPSISTILSKNLWVVFIISGSKKPKEDFDGAVHSWSFHLSEFEAKNQAFLKLALKDYPVQAVFDCAYQGYFLASALHGGFESLTIAFFALRPAPALLRAVQRFLKNSTFHDDLAWNSMGFGPWGCFLVELWWDFFLWFAKFYI